MFDAIVNEDGLLLGRDRLAEGNGLLDILFMSGFDITGDFRDDLVDFVCEFIGHGESELEKLCLVLPPSDDGLGRSYCNIPPD